MWHFGIDFKGVKVLKGSSYLWPAFCVLDHLTKPLYKIEILDTFLSRLLNLCLFLLFFDSKCCFILNHFLTT